MKYNYFEVPTQVKFWDVDGDHYVGGIAYRNDVICGRCAGIVDISEIYEVAPDTLDNDPIVVVKGWKGLSDKICGESD